MRQEGIYRNGRRRFRMRRKGHRFTHHSSTTMSFTTQYLSEAAETLAQIDTNAIDRVVVKLQEVRRQGGRIFFLGVGGSAANAAHAVNDFRKICGFEAYSPTDNVAELTARVNDEGWEDVFAQWLMGSRQ